MRDILTAATAAALPIAAVERETGLAKDTLRVWERRYGFPQPLRDAAGDRRYPPEQVQRLKLIARLLDAGQRPGKVVGLDTAALHALLGRLDGAQGQASKTAAQPVAQPVAQPAAPEPQSQGVALEPFMNAVAAHDPQALRGLLGHALSRWGLAVFVRAVVAPLNAAVGDAWAQGRFEIFEEHLYTEVVTTVLRHALAALPPPPAPGRPRVLLTTLPGQLHGLGLLMVEALLALEGCSCISLGTQTPLTDLVQAAQAHRADVVALSFADVQPAALVRASVQALRAQLPATVALWIGGNCDALYASVQTGVHAARDLASLPALVQSWRASASQAAASPAPHPTAPAMTKE